MAQNVADGLRAAIRASGKSANQLAMDTRVCQTTISRFLRGYDMSVERASKIAAYLGLKISKQ